MEYFVFPDFDPIAIQLGPLAIRWYSLSYVVGLLLAGAIACAWRKSRRIW